jgi:hypothetical protein
VFESGALKGIRVFGHKSEAVQENGENCLMKSFIICSLHQILFEAVIALSSTVLGNGLNNRGFES